DLVSIRVHLHLLLFLQLPPQPRQILLKGIKSKVAALPLPGGAVLSHRDLDLLKLGLRVLQLHLQVLCQLGSLHRLQQGRNRTHSIKKHLMMEFLSCN
ncbi:hypothetical protein FQN60_003300, partial [Etheostoma spectabile]